MFTVAENVSLLKKQKELKVGNDKLKDENEKLKAQLEDFKLMHKDILGLMNNL